MSQFIGKWKAVGNENLDELFKACGKYMFWGYNYNQYHQILKILEILVSAKISTSGPWATSLT